MSLLSTYATGQLRADFEADTLSGCGSLAVNFTDLSQEGSSPIVSWQWDLGGNMASSQNPGRIFPVPAAYTICLTVTDAGGNSDTECKVDYIVVHEIPQAAFTAAPTTGCQPLTVTFTDQSVFTDGASNLWVWGVGGSAGVINDDGTFGSIESTYNIPDDYSVTLTVIDEYGCTNTVTESDLIEVLPVPLIDITADDNFSCNPPLTVNFSNNNIEQNTVFTWDFGNGDPIFNGPTPPPVDYNSDGSYDIILTATDTISGCISTEVLDGFISIGQGVQFELSADTICIGESVLFTDLTTEPANSIEWDFGDGEISTFPQVMHTYDSPGCYDATLTRNLNSCTVSSQTEICVFDYPIADFTLDNPLGCEFPHTVNLTDQSTNATSRRWIFGNNGILGYSEDPNPVLEIDGPGVYPIMLVVEGLGGCRDTMIDTVRTFRLDANIPINNILGCSPITVNLYENSASLVPITDWQWIINDTLIISDSAPAVTITDTGSYNVELIIVNSLGCRDSTFADGLIEIGTPPQVDFTVSPKTGCSGTDIQFTNESSPAGQVWIWNFGDNMISTEEDPVHEFRDTGCFDIGLNVFFNGCNSGLTKDTFVCIEPPIADFVPVFDCLDPLNITFQNNSIGADSVFWDFGISTVDDDTSSATFPVFDYPVAADYTVTLLAFNFSSGCVDTLVRVVQVEEYMPMLNVDMTSGCVPFTVNLTDQSVGVAEREWLSTGGTISDIDGMNTSVTFNAPGMYQVSLVVTNNAGCNDTIMVEITANEIQPAFIVNPQAGCAPLVVDLSDNSTNLFGNTTIVEWVIGDSAYITSGINAQVVIDSAGIYPLSMVIEDDLGCRDSIRELNVIQAFGPIPDFKADTAACLGDTIWFENESIGNGLTFLWDFGDGNTSTLSDPGHLYASEGEYSVCITVTDVNGCDTMICKNEYINIGNPTAAFTFDSLAAQCPPLIVQFQNLSGNATDFIWDFGDNSGISVMSDPQHIYSIPGIYDVTLVAIANSKCRDTAVFSGLVVPDGPSAIIDILGDTTLCLPGDLVLAATGAGNYTFQWDFGDGSIVPGGQSVMNDTVSHMYDTPGSYVPVVTFTDNAGCERTLELGDTIKVSNLQVDVDISPNEICEGGEVQFSSLVTSSDPVSEYLWELPGSGILTSTLANPVVTYDQAGSYDVTLTVNNSICEETVSIPDAIMVGPAPEAMFGVSDSLICIPGTVQFTDLSQIQTGNIDSRLWNFGDGLTSSVQNPSHTFTVNADSFLVTLTVESDIGCTDSISIMISGNTAPQIDPIGDISFCNGDSIILPFPLSGDTSSTNYEWTGPGLSCSGCDSPMALPGNDTTYWFIAENIDGCKDSTSVIVQLDPNSVPEIFTVKDTQICAGTQIQLIAMGGTSVFSYNWDATQPGLSCYTNCANPFASPENTTTYRVRVDNGSCSREDSIRVRVLTDTLNFLVDEVTICEGESTSLNITSGQSPSWIAGSGLSCDECYTVQIAPDSSDLYIAEVTGPMGCRVIDSTTVHVVPRSVADAGPDLSLCLGDSVRIMANIDSGLISWFPLVGISDPTLEQPLIYPTADIEYLLEVDVDGCLLTDSVKVIILDSTDIRGSNYQICEGDTVQLLIRGMADMYNWSSNMFLSDPGISDPLAFPDMTTVFTVVGQLGSCPPDTALSRVEVIPGPQFDLPAQLSFVPGNPISLSLDVSPSGMYTYLWDPSDHLSCTDCPDPLASPVEDITYTVKVTDQLTGCDHFTEIDLVRVDECASIPVGIPNVFSPNNDGINDEFRIYTNAFTEMLRFRVFDRWGNLIFQTDDPDRGWDGTRKNEVMNTGVYVYFVEFRCPIDGSVVQFKGDVTLVR